MKATTQQLIDLVYQIGKVAVEAGEEWRLNHPELMDSYQAVYDYLYREVPPIMGP